MEPQLQRIAPPGGDEPIRVEPKVMDVLVCLAVHAGQTVTKKQFMEDVWDDTVVTDDALLRCISELRKIFGDDPKTPRHIETIRKKGYRLLVPVTPAPENGAAAAVPAATPPPAEVPAPTALAPTAPVPPDAAPLPAALAPAPPLRRAYGWVAGAGVVVLLGVFLLARGVLHPAAPAPLKAVPLTSYPGVESDPNLSPDGSRVAFVWDQEDGGGFDIYLKQVGVETPLRLTRDPAEDSSPAWSPDGQFLAFLRTGGTENGLFIVPVVGGSERMVARLGARDAHSVVWSPDGRTLAFTAERAPHAPFGIFLLSLETLDERVLTVPPDDYRGDLELAFSPDGRRLAFTRSVVEKVDDLYLVGVDGGELKRLTYEHAEITGLDWTPDGRALLYSSDRDGSSTLWRVAASEGRPGWIPTTSEGSSVHQPSLARNGGRMAFVQRLQETNIWADAPAGDSSGAGPHRLIASTRWDSNPALSPDGSRVAFVSNRTGDYEVWTSGRDGSNLLQMTHFGGPFTNTPRWSPDGTRLAFVARADDGVDIYVVGLAAGAPRRLTTAGSNDTAPSWSHDGAWIYFASNRTGSWQVWKIPSKGGTPVQVTQDGGYAAFEDAGGTTLFFTKRDLPGIWRMPLGSAPARAERVVEDLEPFDWGNWAVAPGGLYFVRRLPSGPVVAFYEFETRAVQAVRTLERLPKHPALAVAPDGRLLFTRIDRFEGDIWLVDPFE